MPTPIETLDLDSRLKRRLTKDGVLEYVEQIRALKPWVLAKEWRLTDEEYAALSIAVRQAGLDDLEPLVRPVLNVAEQREKPRCSVVIVEGVDLNPDVTCSLPRMKGKQKCEWHWLLAQPISVQIVAADQRAGAARAVDGFEYRARVPREQWPPGQRWCSECQSFIPVFYAQGSRCKAHESRASHASMVKRVYDLDPAEYQALLDWQGGRCFICQQVPRAKRLAVDHDHNTGEVRGLLCANDEWGCNVTLRRLLNNVEMARRALAYVEQWPLARMRDGQISPVGRPSPYAASPPPPQWSTPPAQVDWSGWA